MEISLSINLTISVPSDEENIFWQTSTFIKKSERERERKKERESKCVFCVCVCVRQRERERDKQRQRAGEIRKCVFECVYVCV